MRKIARCRKAAAVAVTLLLATVLAAPLTATLAATAARAAGPFEVRDVQVDETAETATAAREQAIAAGEAQAFSKLLDRIVDPSERASIAIPERNVLQGLIQDFSIVSEKASAVRYLATMVVRFDPEATRAWLFQQGASFSATESDPVVIVPVWEEAGVVRLWDDPNPWRAAWDAQGGSGHLVPTVLPEGGLEDVATLTARQALVGNTEALNALASRYDTTESVVAYARMVADTQSGTTIVAVAASRFGADGPQWQAEINLRTEESEDRDSVLRRATAAVLQELDQRWKQTSTVQGGEASALDVVVPIGSLRDWVDVRRQLEGLAVVRNLDVQMLARDAVRVRVEFVGNVEQLGQALSGVGMGLEQSEADWLLWPPQRGGPGG